MDKNHNGDKKKAIRVEIDNSIMERVLIGPLGLTGGKGAAPWVRQLILKALEEYEEVTFLMENKL